MAENTSVRHFSSTMPGAPQLDGSRGSMIAVLDATLVNGWGLTALNSLAVSGGVATATITAGVTYVVRQVVRIVGATPVELNGEFRVTAVTTTTFTFLVTGVADGVATGSITSIIAPLGWVKEFASTDKAVYKIDTAKYPTAPAMCLKVDETNRTYTARVSGFESMTDVDNGIGEYPLVSQEPSGLFVFTREVTNGTHHWNLIGDHLTFFFGASVFSRADIVNFGLTWSCFGQIKSFVQADQYNFMVAANASGDINTYPNHQYSVTSQRVTYQYLTRPYDSFGYSAKVTTRTWSGVTASGGSDSVMAYPSPVGNTLYLMRLELWETVNGVLALRGVTPGVLMIPHRATYKVAPGRNTPYLDTAVTGFEGRTIGFFTCTESTTPALVAFDLTGPWEH